LTHLSLSLYIDLSQHDDGSAGRLGDTKSPPDRLPRCPASPPPHFPPHSPSPTSVSLRHYLIDM
jgi:hypothetical protein